MYINIIFYKVKYKIMQVDTLFNLKLDNKI